MFCRQSPGTAVIMFAGIVGILVSVCLLIIHVSHQWDFKLSVKPLRFEIQQTGRVCVLVWVSRQKSSCVICSVSIKLFVSWFFPSVAMNWLSKLRDLHNNNCLSSVDGFGLVGSPGICQAKRCGETYDFSKPLFLDALPLMCKLFLS